MRLPEVLQAYRDEAVRFVPVRTEGLHGHRPLRVARTPLTCEAAAALLNELKLPPEPCSAYRYINVHNPRSGLQYDALVERWRPAPGLEHHPAWGVNWNGAVLMCEFLGARLPLAAEWEGFASCEGQALPYPWGDAEPSPQRANYDEHYGGTTPVDRFAPNALGLLDLAGNIGEWCLDSAPRGMGCERRVKGGAWSKGAWFLRVEAERVKWERLGTTTIGLRPVWDDG